MIYGTAVVVEWDATDQQRTTNQQPTNSNTNKILHDVLLWMMFSLKSLAFWAALSSFFVVWLFFFRRPSWGSTSLLFGSLSFVGSKDYVVDPWLKKSVGNIGVEVVEVGWLFFLLDNLIFRGFILGIQSFHGIICLGDMLLKHTKQHRSLARRYVSWPNFL